MGIHAHDAFSIDLSKGVDPLVSGLDFAQYTVVLKHQIKAIVGDSILFNISTLSDGDGSGQFILSIQGEVAEKVREKFPWLRVQEYSEEQYVAERDWSLQRNAIQQIRDNVAHYLPINTLLIVDESHRVIVQGEFVDLIKSHFPGMEVLALTENDYYRLHELYLSRGKVQSIERELQRIIPSEVIFVVDHHVDNEGRPIVHVEGRLVAQLQQEHPEYSIIPLTEAAYFYGLRQQQSPVIAA